MAAKLKQSPAIILNTKRSLVSQNIQGKESASSTSLANSYDLPVDQVRAIMRVQGVRDDG